MDSKLDSEVNSGMDSGGSEEALNRNVDFPLVLHTFFGFDKYRGEDSEMDSGMDSGGSEEALNENVDFPMVLHAFFGGLEF